MEVDTIKMEVDILKMEVDTIKEAEKKNKVTKEYLRRLRKLFETKALEQKSHQRYI